MNFFNRFVRLYALIVFIITVGYYYFAAHVAANRSGNAMIWGVAAYIIIVFASALIISMKDDGSNYAGFNYHLTTYIIASGVPIILVLWKGDTANKHDNLTSIFVIMLIWGIGLLFHLGMYLFMFRKKNIRSYEKDDVFK